MRSRNCTRAIDRGIHEKPENCTRAILLMGGLHE
jgi:hypothetical protein